MDDRGTNRASGEVRFYMLRSAWLIACVLLVASAFRYWGPVYGIIASFWCSMLMIAGMPTVFLLKRNQWQFGLRTPLLATAVVAAMLGLAVYLTRK
jgi:hypothetical protein